MLLWRISSQISTRLLRTHDFLEFVDLERNNDTDHFEDITYAEFSFYFDIF